MKTYSMNLSIALLGLSFLLPACAHFDERLKNDLNVWVGQDSDKVVEMWGAPSSTYTMQNGTKVLSYANDRSYTRSSGMGYASWRWSNYSYNESCKINFFTDASQKKIERYTTSGDNGACLDALRDLPKP